jgi:hypothetical protein
MYVTLRGVTAYLTNKWTRQSLPLLPGDIPMDHVLEKLEDQRKRLSDAAKAAASDLGKTRTWVHLQCPNGPHQFSYLGKSQNRNGVNVEYECDECQIGGAARFYVPFCYYLGRNSI